MSAPGAVVDVEPVERALRRALASWALASAAAGGALWSVDHRTGRPGLGAAGLQTLLWGGVDGALAVLGAVRARRGGGSTDARRLRRLLLVNAVADVAYVAVGAALAARPDAAARRLRRPAGSARSVRGHGLAVVVQGAFLLVVDAAAALRLRPPDGRVLSRGRPRRGRRTR